MTRESLSMILQAILRRTRFVLSSFLSPPIPAVTVWGKECSEKTAFGLPSDHMILPRELAHVIPHDQSLNRACYAGQSRSLSRNALTLELRIVGGEGLRIRSQRRTYPGLRGGGLPDRASKGG